jgi:hypothetical protein
VAAGPGLATGGARVTSEALELRTPISEEQKLVYAGIWLLKKMDLKQADGGMIVPLHPPSELTPLSEVLVELQVLGHVQIHKRKERWEITKSGLAYLAELIDEADALIDEFDDDEVEDVVAELRRRGLDVFRALFLWEWYTGELDDLVLFQQRRGVQPVETLWAYYLVSDELYATLARAIPAASPDDGEPRARRGAIRPS